MIHLFEHHFLKAKKAEDRAGNSASILPERLNKDSDMV
jgi:hypothetical protein